MPRIVEKHKPPASLARSAKLTAPAAQPPATRAERMARVQQAVDAVQRRGAPGLAALPPQAATELKRRGSALVQQALSTLAKREARLTARPPVLPAEPAGLAQAAAQQAGDRLDSKSAAEHAAARTVPITTPITDCEVAAAPHDHGLETVPVAALGGREVALCHAQGDRREMEDSAAVRWFPDSNIGVAAVFDGHGGDWAAQHAAEIVPRYIEARLKRLAPQQRRDPQAVCGAIADAFAPADPQAKPSRATIAGALEAIGRGTSGGATAIVAVFVDKQLYIANLGDSRAVLAHPDGSAQRLSSDHRIVGEGDAAGGFAARDAETQRVLDHGGTLFMMGSTPRLQGNAAAPSGGELQRAGKFGGGAITMTRALGDLGYPGLGRRPDVNPVQAPAGGVLMLGCDGMFNRVHDDAHAAYISKQRQAGGSLASISENLIKVSHGRRSRDNMTNLLVDLTP